MHLFSGQFDPCTLPRPSDPDRARDALDEWQRALSHEGHVLEKDEHTRQLLHTIFGNSPFLTRCVLRNPLAAAELLRRTPDDAFTAILSKLGENVAAPDSRDSLIRDLRRAREQVALLTAAADIAGVWDLNQVMQNLSDFADAALRATTDFLIKRRMLAGDLALPDGIENEEELNDVSDIAAGAGYFVLAMGKLGAHELNYSSDIDLIAFHDPERESYIGKKSAQDCFIRITRDLAKILQERTKDGYVFRVDLRLRPDAGATPVCISTEAAEIYYQSVGLNWERAAMIKARPVTGDLQAAQDFLERIRAFVWRKHLDFAALEDVHNIKKQIHSHHRHRGIRVAGHDIKLGHGGIREIEFFAQTQQLIAGGRDPALREPQTLRALKALADTGWCEQQTCETLGQAYVFLRTLEHRLQMINDEQTHVLPADDAELTRLSLFMGFEERSQFDESLLNHLHAVHEEYDDLFAEPLEGKDSDEDADAGDIDPGSLEKYGFDDPQKVAEIIHAWSLGRYRACRSDRARRILTNIMPALLKAFAATAGPDGALLRFDDFLRKLPSGVQLFSLFQVNPWLLDVLADIMGTAPRLADTLARNPLLLDAVLTPDFFEPVAGRKSLQADIDDELSRARDYQDVLDLSRRWNNERKFQIGVQLMRGIIDAAQAGRALADLADVTLRALWPRVQEEYAQRYGTFEDAEMAIIALGKYGGRELTFTSDLDLVFVYDLRGDEATSSGPSQAGPSKYFAGLSQRFISAISALTGEGMLYEIDMRLRPSGSAGPIAVRLERFEDYQRSSAWTWEHMALSRFRVICASEKMKDTLDALIVDIIGRDREEGRLITEIDDMRQRLAGEFGTEDIWSVKNVAGGLVDIEFIAQYLVLRHARDDSNLIKPNTADVLSLLEEKRLLDGGEADTLLKAFRLQSAVQALLRLCVGQKFDIESAPPGLKKFLATATGYEDFDALEKELRDGESRVSEIYQNHLADPAERIRETQREKGEA